MTPPDSWTGDRRGAGRGTHPTCANSPAEQSGERIGRYKLLQQIGEGGFGMVWMAEQVEPVTRRVALKIIKLGMDTREVIARFEAGAAGAGDDGPSEHREGLRCRRDGQGPAVLRHGTGEGHAHHASSATSSSSARAERLELFGDVCSAINHAHQKGIIHRDIKPSNVMVTLHGDKPVVKVIDFGIAKATQGKLTDKTLFTRFEQFIGTPVYMSPEQAALERAGHRHAQRHLRAGHPALRTAHRKAAVRCEVARSPPATRKCGASSARSSRRSPRRA